MRSTRQQHVWLALACGSAGLAACSSAPDPSPAPVSTPATHAATPALPASAPMDSVERPRSAAVSGLSVGEVVAQGERLIGHALTVRGRYTGWTGSCKGGPPVSRSDWMLEDAQACLYVHGPLPTGGLPPEAQQGIRPMVVEGLLRKHSDGRLYLEMVP